MSGFLTSVQNGIGAGRLLYVSYQNTKFKIVTAAKITIQIKDIITYVNKTSFIVIRTLQNKLDLTKTCILTIQVLQELQT